MTQLSKPGNGECATNAEFSPAAANATHGKQARAQQRRAAERFGKNGLNKGEPITVLHNNGSGPLVIKLRKGNMILARSIAERVVVT